MADQKKIMIVTSDENLIHQLSSHQILHTYIIDFDKNNQCISMINDNGNITDLTVVTHNSQVINISSPIYN